MHNNPSILNAKNQDRIAAIAMLESARLESIQREEEHRHHEHIQKLLTTVPLCFQGKTFADFKIDYPGQSIIKKIAERYVVTFPDRLKQGSGLKLVGVPGT